MLLTAPQDPAFVLAHNRIIAAKFGNGGAQEARESLDIAVGNGDGGGLAAVGALGAIDLRLDLLRDFAQDAVGVAVVLQIAAEALVFGPFLLALQADLHQVGEHASGVRYTTFATTSVISSACGAPAANSLSDAVTAFTISLAGSVRCFFSTSMKRSSSYSL